MTERVLVVALSRKLEPHVRDYIWALVQKGTWVELVIASPACWPYNDLDRWNAIAANPNVRVHQLNGADARHVLRRLERTVVHRIPGRVLHKKSLQRKYFRFAVKFQDKVFIRVWRIMQPWLMARMFRKRLSAVDFTTIDRIVAADNYGMTLGWKLARCHPNIPATRALET